MVYHPRSSTTVDLDQLSGNINFLGNQMCDRGGNFRGAKTFCRNFRSLTVDEVFLPGASAFGEMALRNVLAVMP